MAKRENLPAGYCRFKTDKQMRKMLKALRLFYAEFTTTDQLMQWILVGAILDVGRLPTPKKMSASQRKGYHQLRKFTEDTWRQLKLLNAIKIVKEETNRMKRKE